MNAIPVIQVARVVSIDDPQGGDRIKVELIPEDNILEDLDNSAYVFPLLPKIFHVKPVVGETVLVITAMANQGNSQRFYIGPVFSQESKIPGETFYGSARSLLDQSIKNIDVNPRNENNAKGCYCDENDIGITGRGNSDIQIKKDDIRIRCGVKRLKGDKSNFNFNVTDPAYIKLQYYKDGLPDYTETRCNSVVNVVGDKINLIGNDSKDGFLTRDPDDLISDGEMKKILEKAHQLPYGDILVDFLTVFRTAFLNHTHPFPMFKPVQDDDVLNVASANLKDMLSDTVRIS